MTKYTVHIYREMRIVFEGIEADTPEAAAEYCRYLPSGKGSSPVDCDGQDFAAVVDSLDDPEGKDILFEEGRLRKAAPRMRGALEWLLADMTDAGEDRDQETGTEYDCVTEARAALADAD